MPFEKWKSEINSNLLKALDLNLPEHQFNEVIRYSVLPAGKLFRPLLVYSLAKDLGDINSDHQSFATSLELHHTYTLIHDDLPAMDDDDMRRGRESSHIKFNEWNAILAGDALINLSYEILSSITPSKLPEILKTYGSLMGPKGLILGQIMDLGHENQTITDILKIHELKTARLIQLALCGSNILSEHPIAPSECHKLGYSLGISFQLLDDLCELTEEVSAHESEINPFLHFNQKDLFNILIENRNYMREVTQAHKLNHLNSYINKYLEKTQLILNNGREILSQNIKLEGVDIVSDLTL